MSVRSEKSDVVCEKNEESKRWWGVKGLSWRVHEPKSKTNTFLDPFSSDSTFSSLAITTYSLFPPSGKVQCRQPQQCFASPCMDSSQPPSILPTDNSFPRLLPPLPSLPLLLPTRTLSAPLAQVPLFLTAGSPSLAAP